MTFPEIEFDLFTDEALLDFHALEDEIRERGPVVRLTACRLNS